MAATLTTRNPQGLGYETGMFSGTPGTPVAQDFFNAAFAGHINTNKIYKEAYHCNIVGSCGISTWMDEMMGNTTSCDPAYTLLETNGQYHQIKISVDKLVRAYPATSNLTLADNSQYVSGAYVLPQVGNTIVLTPSGELAKVTYVAIASTGDAIVTVQLRNHSATDQQVRANDELLVLSGSEIADCACPTGQFAFNDLPLETDLDMIQFGDKGSLCGDALNKCQFLKIPFYDGEGKEVGGAWYTTALADMYTRFEERKHFERLLNPIFGIIPTLRAKAMKFTPASPTEITTDDIRAYKQLLNDAGVTCKEFSIFAGDARYSQYQRMMLQAGVVKLDNTVQPNDCKWIDMNYCGIRVEGLTLHIYEECTFSNGKLLGSGSSIFPNSSIWVPMCDRPVANRSNGRMDEGGDDTKMFTTVYFKSLDGRVWDNVTDSNGILGVRNTFGTGCETQEWTIKTRFTQEIHCAQWWGYEGLG